MPLPFIVGGLLIGAGAHMEANETNEKTQKILDKAKSCYNLQKSILETKQMQAESACKALGKQKKMTMETSVRRFLNAYDKIKDVRMRMSAGLGEIEKFMLSQQETVHFYELSRTYQLKFSDIETGAAVGALISIALGGSPLKAVAGGMLGVSGVLGIEGTVASILTANIPGLSLMAAPALFATGISASIKADENLEKARAAEAETEQAVERMKNFAILCQGIEERARMFENLLTELDQIFNKCTVQLDLIVRQKTVPFQQKINVADLTDQDIKLISVTRALAGAVKTVIDMPILNQSGTLSHETKDKYDQIQMLLPAFEKSAYSVL